MSSTCCGTITLRSNDGHMFEVEKRVVQQHSPVLRHMMEDLEMEDVTVVPIPAASGCAVARLIEYCKKHTKDDNEEETKADEEWDKEFMEGIREFDDLFDVLNAASYLDVKGLLELGFDKVADMIKDMSVEDVRDVFSIVNDYTDEEEKALLKQIEWAFRI